MDTLLFEQGARFEQLIIALGLNQISFAANFNLKQPSISLVVTGKRRMPHKLQIAISRKYGQSIVDWVLTGQGELVLPQAKLDVVNDKTAEYRRTTPGEQLDGHEKRIADLETEIRLLKDMEAEVHRLRGLVEGLMKGGVVKE